MPFDGEFTAPQSAVLNLTNLSSGNHAFLAGNSAAVLGQSHIDVPGVEGTSTIGRGVNGFSDSKGGVVGESNSGDGVAGVTKSQTAAGVFGTGHRAGLFNGNVGVSGILSVTGLKQFPN